jgi:acyl-coenzyme A thioesterase PaaI-like protein
VAPRVQELRPGYCRVALTERGRLKNPFNSVHAVALMNVGELASGLVLTTAFQRQGLRGIVTKLEAEYFKKAKGSST